MVPAAITEEQPNLPAGPQGPVDQNRLRYVTSLLAGQQQGLYTLLFGALFFALEMNVNRPGWLTWLGMLAGLAIYIKAIRDWVPNYYQQRFGSVESQQPSARSFALFLVVVVLLLFFGRPLAHYFDPQVSSFSDRVHLLMSDPGHQINVWPPLLWIIWFLGVLRGPYRSMGSLSYFLLGASSSLSRLPFWEYGIPT
jgi:hypothetical protein